MTRPTITITTKAPAAADGLAVPRGHALPKAIQAELDRQWKTGCSVASTRTLGHMSHEIVVAWETPDEGWTARTLQNRIAAVCRALAREGAKRATVLVPARIPAALIPRVVVGAHLGLYRFDRYKSGEKKTRPSIALVFANAEQARAAKAGVPIGEAIALARDLVNTPAEHMGPSELEAAARRVARDAGLRIRVLNAARCARMGMGALTAVGRASDDPPRLVVLEYLGAPRSKDVLALAGKGICFDTGGLDIKPPSGMELMKKDMAGAAAVLAAASAVARLKPKANVRFYLAIAENAVAGNAFRPGDIVTALDGTTIEVRNTDAEGRLVLADAVALAVREGATRIVDVATLTGAALIALGRVRIPLIGTDEALLAAVEAAADAAGERVWRLPSDKEYWKHIRSKIADIQNVGRAREAGAISAGLFIGHFAKKVPWAHLDISPASWSEGDHDSGPEGATGASTGLLVALACAAPKN